MVFFLTSPVGAGHLEGLIERFDRSQSRHFQEMTYADFVRRGRAPRGAAYVFTDRQRMSAPFQRVMVELWRQLEAADGVRLYSNPAKGLTRYGLLRHLGRTGQNDFQVYSLADLENERPRFPVFVRLEDDHSGPKTELIANEDGLRSELDRLILAGAEPRRLLVVEYLDTADSAGVYYKYGALRIGDKVICQHILQATVWNVKTETRTRSEATVDASDAYFAANPHAELLRPLFELSGIEFGRIDYSMRGERVQVWEINDNPIIAGGPWHREGPRAMSKLNKGPGWFAAFRELEAGVSRGTDIDLDLDRLAAALHGEIEGAA